jgi:protein SCO1
MPSPTMATQCPWACSYSMTAAFSWGNTSATTSVMPICATLTGAPGILAQLWKQLGVYWQKVPEDNPPGTDWLTGKPLTYDINHSDLIFFFDRDGHERFVIDGAGHVEPGTQLPATLRGFLSDQGHNNLAHPEPDSWTVPQALQVINWLTQQQIPPHQP